MNLNCPQCHKLIESTDINVQSFIAKCGTCHNVFHFGDRMDLKPATKDRSPVDLPKQFEVFNNGMDFLIRYRWFSLTAFGLVFFCIFWDGFLVFWYLDAFSAKKRDLAMIFFPVLHVAVGVFLTYLTTAMFVNKTEIKVNSEKVMVYHGPLPWPGNKQISRFDIDQLYVEEKVHRGKHGLRYTYQVHVVNKEGNKTTLVSHLQKREQACFIEQQIELFLGIKDRPMQGEILSA